MLVRTIMGTMGMGGSLDACKSRHVLDLFKKQGYNEVDTAIMYQSGKSESTLAAACALPSCVGGGMSDFKIATKANPWFNSIKRVSTTDQMSGLSPEALKMQLEMSLQSLNLKKVDLFYLHAPDHNTPIELTLAAVDQLHKQDLFHEWGLSNYASWEVVHIYHLCKANNWKPPTVYQGMYNCLTRVVEKELFPALRTCGMRFYSYNPLAGGILTGNYKWEDNPSEGRFSNQTTWGLKYRERFWRKEYFDAISKLEKALQAYNIPLLSASFSWLYHHSQLQAKWGDGVIIGGSSIGQIQQNLDALQHLQELPPDLLQVFDEAWNIVEPISPSYFR